MSDFAGMEELLKDFLMEAGELLGQVDNKLVELEKRPDDKALLNDIFRGFHTIKGGAGFLNVDNMVTLCHRTENLFDKLRNSEITLTPELMDIIMAATATVRDMFDSLAQSVQPTAADPALLAKLDAALAGKLPPSTSASPAATPVPGTAARDSAPVQNTQHPGIADINWDVLHAALTGAAIPTPEAAPASPPRTAPVTPVPAAQEA